MKKRSRNTSNIKGDKTPTEWVGPGRMAYRVGPNPFKVAIKKRLK